MGKESFIFRRYVTVVTAFMEIILGKSYLLRKFIYVYPVIKL